MCIRRCGPSGRWVGHRCYGFGQGCLSQGCRREELRGLCRQLGAGHLGARPSGRDNGGEEGGGKGFELWNPLRDVLTGKRVIVVDDSIVRGTTSRKLVAALRKAGATEVHMRISSPPVTHPCFYGIDTDSQDQLVAANLSLSEIAEQIGVDSLGYLSIAGMLQAAQDDDRNFCKACFTGDYPVDVPEGLKRSKLKLEKVSH